LEETGYLRTMIANKRCAVWEYAGVNTFRAGRLDELAMHPTVKPVAMLADAIRDVTKRGAIVLDPFAGSGSTLIAAEKTGRQARCIEFEPKYCDVIVRRWQAYTGKAATFEGTDLTFEDFEGARASSPASRAAKSLSPAVSRLRQLVARLPRPAFRWNLHDARLL
jgi:hypothetical protein